jgi:hypothetical protein
MFSGWVSPTQGVFPRLDGWASEVHVFGGEASWRPLLLFFFGRFKSVELAPDFGVVGFQGFDHAIHGFLLWEKKVFFLSP